MAVVSQPKSESSASPDATSLQDASSLREASACAQCSFIRKTPTCARASNASVEALWPWTGKFEEIQNRRKRICETGTIQSKTVVSRLASK